MENFHKFSKQNIDRTYQKSFYQYILYTTSTKQKQYKSIMTLSNQSDVRELWKMSTVSKR